MAKISGSIPNFANGISQQADAIRMTTQGKEQVNAYSTVVDGLIKRPPTKLVAKISSGAVFADPIHSHFINRDTTERYNVLLSKSGIKVFTLDGVEKTVNTPDGISYLDYSGSGRPPYRALTIGDYTFITNTTVVTSLDATNLAPARPNEAIIHVLAGNYGKTYEVQIDGNVVATYATPDGSSAAQSSQIATSYIAGQLYDDLVAANYNTGDWSLRHFKGTLYLSNSVSDFSIDTDDGYNDEAMKAFKNTAQDFEDLPSHCENGFTIQITGTPGNDYDNYYVEFETQDTDTSLGFWKEVAAPGTPLSFDATTMPHVLIREATGDFTFKVAEWDERLAGDETTLPPPSFVGRAISEIVFFKNRLGLLSGESVVLGKSGSYFDWFRTTATALLDDDPIDVASTAPGVTSFRSGVAFADRLVLFADQNQLVLMGNELLTPKTASIRPSTAYASSSICRPVASGDTVFFSASRGDYTMVREYAIGEDNGLAIADEITGHTPQYITGNVTKLAASTHEDILIALSDDETDTLFVYKYYWANETRLQASWSKWQFPGAVSILDAAFLDSKLYLIVQRSDGTFIESMDVQPGSTDNSAGFITHLDRRFTHTDTGARTYNSVTDETTVPMVVDITTDDYLCVTSADLSTTPGISSSIVSKTPTEVVLDGDRRNDALFFGTNYTMNYTLSTIYLRSRGSEGGASYTITEGRLQLLHLIIQCSQSNYFKVVIHHDGRPDREYVRTAHIIDNTDSVVDSVSLTDDPFKVPILARNTKCSVEIINDSYLPSSLLSAEWVANYVQQSRRI